jgi:hypothetical protein
MDTEVTLHDDSKLPQRLTIGEACRIARRHPRTLRRWIACGYVDARQPAGAGPYLIDRDALLRFLDGGLAQ